MEEGVQEESPGLGGREGLDSGWSLKGGTPRKSGEKGVRCMRSHKSVAVNVAGKLGKLGSTFFWALGGRRCWFC